ncbi:hypothetical protein SCUCBS95973_003811 [Sporothrix curviconia]|uniref:Pentatricopeptide repeat protein n=1 Tax=Sporothrix curviconia TaxID=1260050 RepID=A0ABP0BIV7_9PEZI
MKASRRIDRAACGAVLSACVPQPPASVPCPGPGHRRSPPSRCLHDQRRPLQYGRPHSKSHWALTAGAPDPASGTLLPLLFPPTWTSSWKTPCGRKAMHALESACHAVERNARHKYNRSNHTSAAAAASSQPEEHEIFTPPDTTVLPPVPTSPADIVRPRRAALSKDELLSFVDPPADGDTVEDHMEFIRDPYMRRYAQADEPEVVVSHTDNDEDYPTWRDVAKADDAVQRVIHELSMAVGMRLHNPNKASAHEVYNIYRKLPGTRMSHVPATLRHQLLKSLGMVEKKDAQSMLRYFAVVSDIKDCGFALQVAEWNAAISFAARYVGTSSATEVEAAVNLWREMEQEANIQGNSVTFNILFDVASKGGNFTLADMVYKEMEKRGFRFNRYHHVSLIHFFGLKLDADGIRVAYQEMVKAGEMIDIVVLNCVMAGFLRCGEEDAAERVYQRMHQTYLDRLNGIPKKTRAEKGKGLSKDLSNNMSKDLSAEAEPATTTASTALYQPSSPPPSATETRKLFKDLSRGPASLDTTNFASQKVMTDVLHMLAKVSRGNSKLRARYQLLVPTRPNLATYRILINHYAVRLGDLSSCTRFLSDMKRLHIPLHGAIFLALFKGFALHGGRPGMSSDWSERRLRSIWSALLKALDDEVEGLYISTWLIEWALRAFDRCSTPEMVFKAYNSLTSRWDPSEADADFSIGVLHRLLKSRQPRPTYRDDDGSSHSRGGKGRRWLGAKTSIMSQLGSQSFG